MEKSFTLSKLFLLFPTDDACLDEIRRLRYPKGIFCPTCDKETKHYKIKGRSAYSCEFCRRHVYPLTGTIFEKTTTPLRVWFYCLYLMTATRGTISAKKLQRELGVTYKTAWRMYKSIHRLMEQHNGDLLESQTFTWSIFNRFEFKIVQKQEPV